MNRSCPRRRGKPAKKPGHEHSDARESRYQRLPLHKTRSGGEAVYRAGKRQCRARLGDHSLPIRLIAWRNHLQHRGSTTVNFLNKRLAFPCAHSKITPNTKFCTATVAHAMQQWGFLIAQAIWRTLSAGSGPQPRGAQVANSMSAPPRWDRGPAKLACATAPLAGAPVVALAARLGWGTSGALMPGTVTYTRQEMPQIRHGRASGAMPGPEAATCPCDVHRCSCRASWCTCRYAHGQVIERPHS